jgi:hypothetical protein
VHEAILARVAAAEAPAPLAAARAEQREKRMRGGRRRQGARRLAGQPQGGLVGYQQNGTREAPTGQWLSFQQVYRLFYDPVRVSAVLDHPRSGR